MDIGAVGAAGPPIPLGDAAAAISRVAATAVAAVGQDSVGGLAQLLSTPQINHLLSGIDARMSSHAGAALDASLQAAVAALADRNVPRALGHLAEYIKLNPGRADALLTTPSLMPIQAGVQELLRHMTFEAKIEAERLIAGASVLVSAAAGVPPALNGPDLLAVAQRFAESGLLVNYVLASELSQTVISAYSGVARDARPPVPRRGFPELMRISWRRVPMLVLLGGWLALGLVGAGISLLARLADDALSPAAIQTGFELWGVGFLALVMAQFLIKSLKKSH